MVCKTPSAARMKTGDIFCFVNDAAIADPTGLGKEKGINFTPALRVERPLTA